MAELPAKQTAHRFPETGLSDGDLESLGQALDDYGGIHWIDDCGTEPRSGAPISRATVFDSRFERKKLKRVTLIIGAVLVLSACASESGETTTTAVEDATTATAAAETTTTSAPTTTTTEATTTSTASGTGGGGETCLIGDWELDSRAFMESLSETFSEEAGTDDLTIEFVGGSYIVSLGETGIFTGDRDEWAFETTMQEGAIRITIDGLDTGSWEADGSTLVINDYESASVLKAQAVVDGELVDLPQGTVPMTDSNAVTPSSTYQCSGDTLVITADEDFTSEFTRVSG